MNALAQLSMFEPDAAEAARLVDGYLKAAQRAADAADRFDLLQMRGLAVAAERSMLEAVHAASVLAIYADLLELAGEV